MDRLEIASAGQDLGAEKMQKALGLAGVIAIILASGTTAVAGPWEDGMVAYNRGDYVPAIKLFRPMAQAGNTKAQNLMGVMYHKGEGVARNSAKAFMWFSLAAKKGDTQAKTNLQQVTKEMSSAEMTQAKQMTVACEASLYRDCED
jgi:TPR repeat protein